jgi:hypothetical protein
MSVSDMAKINNLTHIIKRGNPKKDASETAGRNVFV